MDGRKLAGTAVEVLVVAVVLSLLVGQLLGQPVLLGYVQTDSMEPTMEPNDGYVAIPTWIAGEPEPGDVVTFQAREVHGGELTTHRIVDETERGYMTRGDGNPFTDQAAGEPPVRRGQVVAVALQVEGHVVTVPHLGTFVEATGAVLSTVQRRLAALTGTRTFLGVQGIGILVAVLAVLLYGIDLLYERRRRTAPGRSRERDRDRETRQDLAFVAAAVTLVVLVATASMVVPGGYRAVSGEVVPADRINERTTGSATGEYPPGGSTTVHAKLFNRGLVPVVAVMEPRDEGIEPRPNVVRIPARGSENATLAVTAPERRGEFTRGFVERRYLGVLPASTIHDLHAIHPLVAVAAIDVVLASGFGILAVVLVGGDRLRRRRRNRDRSLPATTRLRRTLRGKD